MKYKANYHVKGAFSSGFGVKYSDQHDETKEFSANNDVEGFKKAYSMGLYIANENLSDPDDDKTTVTLTSLQSPDGREINQEDILRKIAKEKNATNIDTIIEREMSDGKIQVFCTMQEHIMNIFLP